MSLQLAAQHLASKGRGPDTTLVHMTPREVAGLQALARAHGGSLSVNPDTGLPEAGFLSSILPMIAGVALGPAGLGLSAMQAAMATGAVGALATGDLRKGLMAGLGAYGGAGLGGSIAGLGAVTGEAVSPTVGAAMNAPAAMPVAPAGADMYRDLAEVGIATPSPVTSSVVQGTALPPAYLNGMVDPMGGFPVPANGGYTVDPMGGFPGGAPATATAMPAPAPAPAVDVPVAVAAPAPEVTVDPNVNAKDMLLQRGEVTSPAFVPPKSPLENFKSGLGAVMDDPSKLFKKENMKYGLAALAPLLLQEQKKASYKGSGPNPYQYRYNPGRLATPTRTGDQGQYAYFNPSYTRLAEGGTVQAMSDRNEAETFVANGGQMFADGGDVGTPVYSYIYDPITRTYRDPSKAQPVTTVTQMPGVSRGYSGEPGPVTAGSPGDGSVPFDTMTQEQQAQFYAEHPTMAAITQFGQGLFGLTSLGQLQNAMVPNFVADQSLIAHGINPVTSVNSVQAQNGLDVGWYPTGAPSGGGDYEVVDNSGGSDPVGGGGADIVDNSGGSDPTDGGIAGVSDNSGGDLARGGLTALRSSFAQGGYNLGDYSDGGRLLRGPGDGVSDSIPAVIANKRPARLADGEFVIPARIVSELGNGSTNAGAKKLYAMMDRIQKGRSKSVGKGKVAVNSRSDKYLPA